MTPERAKRVRKLHDRAVVIDCHNDSLRAIAIGDTRYNPPKEGPPEPRRLWQKAESGHWDFPRALEARQSGQVTNILVPRPRNGPYLRTCLKSYQQALRDLEHAPELAILATSAADFERAKREGKVAFLLGIEGAEGIEGDLDLLHLFHRLGVRTVGLTWMYRNEVAEGNWEDTGDGLSPFGRQAVQEMNQLKMLVDVAHATEQTFWDTLEASNAPVICSHTSCRALVKGFGEHAPSRYLTDEQLKALAEQGGVLGIFFSANRELDDDNADVHDLARFFAHAAEVAGAEHVGFGSDFDGGFPPPGLEDIRGLPNLTSALIDVGFSDEELLGILGGNWLRVFREVLRE
ncbi:MAG: dipeptidase [Gemmatimonadota bacterium]|nr:MAG: dipeptidase [Gemmatimonadota bacterium]